ncbi:hypothetical protein ACTFIT_011108 [Dictyostelium discoideum]
MKKKIKFIVSASPKLYTSKPISPTSSGKTSTYPEQPLGDKDKTIGMDIPQNKAQDGRVEQEEDQMDIDNEEEDDMAVDHKQEIKHQDDSKQLNENKKISI